jgi:hypothetical protein
MSVHPTVHPTTHPSSWAETSDGIRWTYNPEVELGEGHGLMWSHEHGWLTWRDQPTANGDIYIQKMSEDDVPGWAKRAVKNE